MYYSAFFSILSAQEINLKRCLTKNDLPVARFSVAFKAKRYSKEYSLGPLMLDFQAEMLLPEEKEKLAHPTVGGVILFTRNFHDKAQLQALVDDIRKYAHSPLLIAVDHEGGRVQRFKDGFTHLPAMGEITALSNGKDEAISLSRACGVVMAYELKKMDIDFSFAPVLDINNISQVIGDRAFGRHSEEVIPLAHALIDGLHEGNMPAIGKHFPGHGSVTADSHIALPVDERCFEDIARVDMAVFKSLIGENKLDGIMPAHVIYSTVCDKPAGFSHHWLQTVLKQQLAFSGAVFSDDLSMHGASVAGNYVDRARAALSAGCDMVLACNNEKGAEAILDGLSHDEVFHAKANSAQVLMRLAKRTLTIKKETYLSAQQQVLRALDKR